MSVMTSSSVPAASESSSLTSTSLLSSSRGGVCEASVETMNAQVSTDPDCLGPCEPGTCVFLEGIVWSESTSGQYCVSSSVCLSVLVFVCLSVAQTNMDVVRRVL